MQHTATERLVIEGTTTHDDRTAFARDMCMGFTSTPKRLCCRHVYDARGSELFDQICEQPEYYLTRAERQILVQHAEEIVGELSPNTVIVELGSGSAEKTRVLIEAFIARHGHLHYAPIDISGDALQASAHGLLEDLLDLQVTGYAGEYAEGLEFIAERFDEPLCMLWLGSSVGNLTREGAVAFLSRLRRSLSADDSLIMGVDLRKNRCVLEAAYDDAAGVTARFNRNLFERINREFAGGFDFNHFEYRARYDTDRGVVDMYQVSKIDQTVQIADLGLEVPLSAGERIHIESSHKYSTEEIDALATLSGFEVDSRWLDANGRFTLNRLVPNGFHEELGP